MLRVLVRRSRDVEYFTNDHARELDGLRDGAPGWWLRGAGDLSRPEDVARVFTSSDRAAVVGYDIVVAAPRPVSILVALDPDHAADVIRAHRASVSAAITYLEDRALLVREQRENVRRDVPARWERIASYTHGINRHGEPHLHDHVLVGARPEHVATVLDSRSLFAHVPAADALYRSSLRYELRSRTPWTAWRSFKGVEHVRDLDEGYRALWGGHHADRGQKQLWERHDVVATWRHDLERWESQGVVASPARTRDEFDEHSFSGAFEGQFAVARRHVVAAWANAAVYGQAPGEMTRSIEALYPELHASRGIRELMIGVGAARRISTARELGARPLRVEERDRWIQYSRERSGSTRDRSR